MAEDFSNNTPKQSLGCLPYAIGGASFIPLIGVVFGLVAIVWGLTKRKAGGLKLVALGAGGICFTILLYGGLFYFGFVQRGGVYDNLRAQLAQSLLPTLVKSIEYYKLQNGHYPKSLLDLKGNVGKEELLFIHDPTHMELKAGEPRLFFYQLEPDGAHYYLLSVGPDGTPFTADDIVPAIPEQELKNIGLKIAK